MNNTVKRTGTINRWHCIIALAAVIAFSSAACDGGGENNNGERIIIKTERGTHGGYEYELWNQDDHGTVQMTLGSEGTFKCSWDGILNVLFRTGKRFTTAQTHQQIGDIILRYNAIYAPQNVSYLCVYGWTQKPLIEYYVIENWNEYNPSRGAIKKGEITVDGHIYDIYESTRTNQPSIEGNKTFQQYWSVNRTKRTGGTVSVSEHFKKWESLGMRLGTLYEVAITVEGYNGSRNGSGSAEITENTLTITK